MYVPYNALPQNSRVWIYQCNRIFTSAELEEIKVMTTDFVEQWTRHGENVRGSFKVVYDRFLIIAVDQDFVEVSGCSIDASVKLVQQMQANFQVNMLNKLSVAYKQNEVVKVAALAAFTKLVKEGVVTKDTIVFNNMIDTLEGVENQWEVPAKESWHARFFN